jgi:uncharacterized protein YggU (UPF0235/DUF167 family)
MVINVRVHPAARKAKVEKLGPTDYKVHVLAPPERGEANREVRAALARHFEIPASRIRILRGETSRLKLVGLDLSD